MGQAHFALASPVAVGGLATGPLELALVNALPEGADADGPQELARRLRPAPPPDALHRAANRVAGTLAERMLASRRFAIF